MMNTIKTSPLEKRNIPQVYLFTSTSAGLSFCEVKNMSNHREIPLTQGKVALVDAEDYEQLNKHKWHAQCNNNGNWYANRTVWTKDKSQITVRMHREILNVPKGMQVDHINHDGLDNCRQNLRLCTRSQNAANQRNYRKRKTSCFKGIYWSTKAKKWHVSICCQERRLYLGMYKNETNAALAYNKAATKLFGKFACLNPTENGKE